VRQTFPGDRLQCEGGKFLRHIIACVLTASFAFATAGSPMGYAKRKPLLRPAIDEKIVLPPTGSSIRTNPRTGEVEEYPLEGEVTLDPRSGYFRLSWNGRDGQRKLLIWEPPWNVDAVVDARVEYDLNGHAYRYVYSMQNLPTSMEKLQALFVSVQAAVEKVEKPDDTWFSYPLTDVLLQKFEVTAGRGWSQAERAHVGLLPGQKATGFSYRSAGLPAIVKCWGRARMRGHSAGEEAPDVLVDAISKYNWMVPQGYTIGPDERLGKMSLAERLKYLVEHLPKMLELGWIENQKVMGWYETNLKAGKAAEVRARAAADFKKNLVTSEVLALMTYLTR